MKMSKELLILNDTVQRLEGFLKRIDIEQIRKQTWETEAHKLLLDVDEKKNLTTTLLEVVELYKELGGQSENDLLNKMKDFVTYGIGVVFGSQYSFVPSISYEGKDLRVDFDIETGDLRTKVIGAKGGGLAEVVSILLQVFFLLVDTKAARFLVLDAALIHLSERYWKSMSQLLSEVCNKTDIQILLMAHSGDYGEYADVLYEFTQVKGETKSRRIK